MRLSSGRRWGLVLGVLVVVMLVPAMALAAPTKIDDTAFTYGGGTWTIFNDASMFSGANHYSGSTGAWAEVTFTGTQMTYISTTGNNRGNARILIDGVEKGIVNQYSAAVVYQVPLLTVSGLAPGSHTLRVERTGTGGGPYIEVDAIEVDTITPPATSTPASVPWSIALLGAVALGAVAVSRRRLLAR